MAGSLSSVDVLQSITVRLEDIVQNKSSHLSSNIELMNNIDVYTSG